MKTSSFFLMTTLGLAGWSVLATEARGADQPQLSAERLEILDKRGVFTPGFKAAVHALIDDKAALAQAQTDEKKLKADLPGLESQAADAQAQLTQLRTELSRYDHPELVDFAALQGRMQDPTARPEDILVLAQAYVWTFPDSPHQAEAAQYLQQVQKKLADQAQEKKDQEAAQAASFAKLLQRVQARDLSLAEWREFLRDKTQTDVLKYIGRPVSASSETWVYTGPWTTDPYTGQKVGLQVNFNGLRVNSVAIGAVAQ